LPKTRKATKADGNTSLPAFVALLNTIASVFFSHEAVNRQIGAGSDAITMLDNPAVLEYGKHNAGL
jgi:hypothetical protein